MNNIATVDFLRHGAPIRSDIFMGVTNDHLSELGWKQMSNILKIENWDKIISSPLIRCASFARNIAESRDIYFHVDKRLQEYNFGDWDGKTYESVLYAQTDLVEKFFNDPETSIIPNGENFNHFKKRIVQCWKELRENIKATEKILIISHGGVILVLLGYILGIKHAHKKINMPYASFSRIQIYCDSCSAKLMFHR